MLSESLLRRAHSYVEEILGSSRRWRRRAIFSVFIQVIKIVSVSCYAPDMERNGFFLLLRLKGKKRDGGDGKRGCR